MTPIEVLTATLAAAIQQRDKLAEVLRQVQWSYTDDMGTYDACPLCLGDMPKHSGHCDIAAALDAIKEGK